MFYCSIQLTVFCMYYFHANDTWQPGVGDRGWRGRQGTDFAETFRPREYFWSLHLKINEDCPHGFREAMVTWSWGDEARLMDQWLSQSWIRGHRWSQHRVKTRSVRPRGGRTMRNRAARDFQDKREPWRHTPGWAVAWSRDRKHWKRTQFSFEGVGSEEPVRPTREDIRLILRRANLGVRWQSGTTIRQWRRMAKMPFFKDNTFSLNQYLRNVS